MPLSGGTSGAHDDSMHQGNAKRDIAGGVGGLDASGFLLAKGAGILFPRTGSDDVHIYERTSGEEAYAFHRVGADDYTFYIKESNVWKQFQTESMKDVVNGIAALNGSGHLLVPNCAAYFVRGGGDQIEFYERTSDERILKLSRLGANDYNLHMVVSGGLEKVQTTADKDAANGIAGLDANIQLDLLQMRPFLEEYSNHLGAVDNFTETVTGGNGTANTDAANHEMDLSSGITVTGYAKFGMKDGFTLGAKPLVFSALIQNISLGAGGQRWEKIGLCVTWNHPGQNNEVGFMYQSSIGNWYTKTRDGANEETNNITALANGDLCTIIVTNSKALFFVNGTLVATHTLYIPTVGMTAGVVTGTEVSAATSSIDISVDMISLKLYK